MAAALSFLRDARVASPVLMSAEDEGSFAASSGAGPNWRGFRGSRDFRVRVLGGLRGRKLPGSCREGQRWLTSRRRRSQFVVVQGNGTEVAIESTPALRGLYPPLKSFEKGNLQVSEKHTIHFQIFGNPNGKPALFLHGGPGAGCTSNHARFFDPSHYKIVLFDQRGCGASRPRGSLEENTTWDLVGDIEKLRESLGVDRWAAVLGGSWGVTLALAYAQRHARHVAAVVLRGVCLLRREELRWFYGQGASSLFPFAWETLLSAVDATERSDLISAFYARLTSPQLEVQERAASAWLRWEMALSSFSVSSSVIAWDGEKYSTSALPQGSKGAPSVDASAQKKGQEKTSDNVKPEGKKIVPSPSVPQSPLSSSSPSPEAKKEEKKREGEGEGEGGKGKGEENGAATKIITNLDPEKRMLEGSERMSGTVVQSRIESHYFYHDGFLEEAQLLKEIDKMRNVRGIIVHGRFDFVCPLKNAFDLHRAWPEAELRIVPSAGHSMYEPGIVHELVSATDRLRDEDYDPRRV